MGTGFRTALMAPPCSCVAISPPPQPSVPRWKSKIHFHEIITFLIFENRYPFVLTLWFFSFPSHLRNQTHKDIKWSLGSLTLCRKMPSSCFAPFASCPWNPLVKAPRIQGKQTVALGCLWPRWPRRIWGVPGNSVSRPQIGVSAGIYSGWFYSFSSS